MIMKKICRRTKSARSSVMTFSAAARDLPQNVIPANKPRSGRPSKTSKHTDSMRSQELHRKHHLSASEFNEMHQDHVGKRLHQMYRATPEKGPDDIKTSCCLQNSPDCT